MTILVYLEIFIYYGKRLLGVKLVWILHYRYKIQ